MTERDEWDRVMAMTDAALAEYRQSHLEPLRALVADVTAQGAFASAVIDREAAVLPLVNASDRPGLCPHGQPYTHVRADGHRRCVCVLPKRSVVYA